MSHQRKPFRKCRRAYDGCRCIAVYRKLLQCALLRHPFILVRYRLLCAFIRVVILKTSAVRLVNKLVRLVLIFANCVMHLSVALVKSYKYIAGCFQKKNTWSSPGTVHLDNLKELAKRFRLHKSIPNFFRDYTTEDSLVAVLKRYVRNNAAFLSLTPSVASARRAGHPQTDTGGGGGMTGTDSGDGQHAIRNASSIDSASLLEGGGSTASGSLTTAAAAGDGEHTHRATGVGGGNAYTRVLSSEALQPGGAGSGAIGHTSRAAPGLAASGVPHTTRAGRGRRTSSSQPRRVLQPKRPTKVRARSARVSACAPLKRTTAVRVRVQYEYVLVRGILRINLVREYH